MFGSRLQLTGKKRIAQIRSSKALSADRTPIVKARGFPVTAFLYPPTPPTSDHRYANSASATMKNGIKSMILRHCKLLLEITTKTNKNGKEIGRASCRERV